MIIKKQTIEGVFEIKLEPHIDQRGFFMRTYDEDFFKKNELDRKWVQESHSYSKKKGIIRGFHFQYPPFDETKLIRVIEGRIMFIIIDLRYKSKTFGDWIQLIVSSQKKNTLYIPRGCALGMCTLSNNCHLLYKMDNYFSPKHSGVIRWDDPDLKVKWPVKIPSEISDKDANAQNFKEFIKLHKWLKV